MERLKARLGRLASGWTVVALICACVLAVWLPDLDLPLGNSDDGRILGRFGLHARNFWELGAAESRFGAAVEPFIREGFGAVPREPPPQGALVYANHPPLQMLITVASTGVLGDNLPALRIVAFMMGAATVAFMALLLRVRAVAWGPTLLAVTAMASTGFFYVYARIGVGYSLLVASTAAVAWLREAERPSRFALVGVGALAAFTAMQSWIAMATLGLLAIWLCTAPKHRSSARVLGGALGVGEASCADAGRDAARVPGDAPDHKIAPNPGTGRAACAPGADANRGPAGQAPSRSSETKVIAAPQPAAGRRTWSSLASKWSPSMTTFVAGAAAGGLLTAVWMISATDIEVLAERVAFRTGTDVSTAVEKRNFSFGEFLSRQWEFAGHELMAPLWLRVLLFPALLAGLADRRTRIPVAITLTIAATLTFTFMQGAWIHRLWNFPWLAPATIGLAALFDAVRRALRGSLARLRSPLGAFCAVGTVATLFLVVTGGTREFYLTGPADAGAVLEEAAERGVETDWVWTTPGISTARWVSYYLDAPVWGLDEELFDDLRDTDLVLVRNDRVPDYLPPGALDEPLAAGSSYTLVSAEALRR